MKTASLETMVHSGFSVLSTTGVDTTLQLLVDLTFSIQVPVATAAVAGLLQTGRNISGWKQQHDRLQDGDTDCSTRQVHRRVLKVLDIPAHLSACTSSATGATHGTISSCGPQEKYANLRSKDVAAGLPPLLRPEDLQSGGGSAALRRGTVRQAWSLMLHSLPRVCSRCSHLEKRFCWFHSC